MDNKQLTARLAKKCSIDYRETSELIQAVNSAIVSLLGNGDGIAIPGFGTFATVKQDEEIVRDLSTGKQIMLPPHISMTFTAGAMLKKQI